MTGIQALERKAPDLPMSPGKIERQEFEYIRHGTQTLIASFDVASGKVIFNPLLGKITAPKQIILPMCNRRLPQSQTQPNGT